MISALPWIQNDNRIIDSILWNDMSLMQNDYDWVYESKR